MDPPKFISMSLKHFLILFYHFNLNFSVLHTHIRESSRKILLGLKDWNNLQCRHQLHESIKFWLLFSRVQRTVFFHYWYYGPKRVGFLSGHNWQVTLWEDHCVWGKIPCCNWLVFTFICNTKESNLSLNFCGFRYK